MLLTTTNADLLEHTSKPEEFHDAVSPTGSENTQKLGFAEKNELHKHTLRKATNPSGVVEGRLMKLYKDHAYGHCGWRPTEASDFLMRGKNYLKDGKKYPCQEMMYDIVGSFALEPQTAILDRYEIMNELRMDGRIKEDWNEADLPETLVFNLRGPNEAPSMWYSPSAGDTGMNHITFHELNECGKREFKNDGPLARSFKKLLAQGCSKKSSGSECLKTVVIGSDYSVFSLPSIANKANGKPMLLHGSISWVRHKNCMVIDIDQREWAYITRLVMWELVKDEYADVNHKCLLTVAHLIEGRSEDTLPERLLTGYVSTSNSHKDVLKWKNSPLSADQWAKIIADNEENLTASTKHSSEGSGERE